jgi:hypothetical protein
MSAGAVILLDVEDVLQTIKNPGSRHQNVSSLCDVSVNPVCRGRESLHYINVFKKKRKEVPPL